MTKLRSISVHVLAEYLQFIYVTVIIGAYRLRKLIFPHKRVHIYTTCTHIKIHSHMSQLFTHIPPTLQAVELTLHNILRNNLEP